MKLVRYNTAKLANSLGFYKDCKWKGCSYKCLNTHYKEEDIVHFDCKDFTIPYQNELVDWLREIYNIAIEVHLDIEFINED